MAEGEIKSREAKLDFDEDVLAGKMGKLEITLQEMEYSSSVSVRGRFESIKYFKAIKAMLFCVEQGLQGSLWKSNVILCNLVDSPKYKLMYESWMPKRARKKIA